MTSGAGTSAFQQAPFAASYTGSSTPFLMANPTSQLLSVPHWHLPISSSMPVLPEVDVPLKRADYPGSDFGQEQNGWMISRTLATRQVLEHWQKILVEGPSCLKGSTRQQST